MAKRARKEIDEEAIRRMMSGDIPRLVEAPAAGRETTEDAAESRESEANAGIVAVPPQVTNDPGSREYPAGRDAKRQEDIASTPAIGMPGNDEVAGRRERVSLPGTERDGFAGTPQRRNGAVASEGVPAKETTGDAAAGGRMSSTPGNAAPDGRVNKFRRHCENRDYAAVYLHRRQPERKRQTYMSETLYVKLAEILAVVGGGLTIPAFIDNLLEEHFEQHREEINDLYDTKVRRPL